MSFRISTAINAVADGGGSPLTSRLKAVLQVGYARAKSGAHIGVLASNEPYADFSDNKDVVLAAVKHDGNALNLAAARWKDDYEVVMAAVNQSGVALRHASERLKGDEDVVMAAVTTYASALEYASETLRNNYKVVMAAVNRHGVALLFASNNMQSMKSVVMAAVTTYGNALQDASDKLKDDEDVVLTAVRQIGTALKHASARLKANKEVVLAATAANLYAFQFASASIAKDKNFIVRLAKTNGLTYYNPSVFEKLRQNNTEYFMESFEFRFAAATATKNPSLVCFAALPRDIEIGVKENIEWTRSYLESEKMYDLRMQTLELHQKTLDDLLTSSLFRNAAADGPLVEKVVEVQNLLNVPTSELSSYRAKRAVDEVDEYFNEGQKRARISAEVDALAIGCALPRCAVVFRS